MRKNYCTKCKKYKEFKKPEISYICVTKLLHSIICNKCGIKDENMKRMRNHSKNQKLLVWLIICKLI